MQTAFPFKGNYTFLKFVKHISKDLCTFNVYESMDGPSGKWDFFFLLNLGLRHVRARMRTRVCVCVCVCVY